MAAPKRKPAGDTQKRMVLNLLLEGKKVYLTKEGKGHLWGEELERGEIEGGGIRIKYGQAKKREAIG